MSMGPEDYVYKGLEHIRLIHFSVLVISVTLIYLTASNWNDGPEIYQELESLRTELRIFAQSNVSPLEIPFLGEEVFNDKRPQLLRQPALAPTMAVKVNVDDFKLPHMPLNVRQARNHSRVRTSSSLSAFAPISDIFSYLQNSGWYLEIISSISFENPLSKDCVDALNRQAEAPICRNNNSAFTRDQLICDGTATSSVIDTMRIDRWPSDSEMGHAFVELKFDTAQHIIQVQDLGPDLPKTRKRREVQNHTTKCSAEIRFSTTKYLPDSISIPVTKRYPILSKHMSEIATMNLSEAIAWAEAKRGAGILAQRPAFLGISVGSKGEHIVTFGLLLSFVQLVYFLLYAQIVRAYLSNYSVSAFSTPWICTSNTRFSQAVSLLTIILVPTVAILVSLWRILGAHWFLVIVAGILGALICLCCYVLTQEIAKKIHENTDLVIQIGPSSDEIPIEKRHGKTEASAITNSTPETLPKEIQPVIVNKSSSGIPSEADGVTLLSEEGRVSVQTQSSEHPEDQSDPRGTALAKMEPAPLAKTESSPVQIADAVGSHTEVPSEDTPVSPTITAEVPPFHAPRPVHARSEEPPCNQKPDQPTAAIPSNLKEPVCSD